MTTTRVVLIRHGEADSTKADRTNHRRLAERTCGGLTSRGREQVAVLAERLRHPRELRPTMLYSSGVRRADETAGLLVGAFGLDGFTRDEALADMRHGDGDGLTLDEVVRRFGDRWRCEPYAPIAPGGEAWAEFCVWAGRAVMDLAHRYEGSATRAGRSFIGGRPTPPRRSWDRSSPLSFGRRASEERARPVRESGGPVATPSSVSHSFAPDGLVTTHIYGR